MVAARIRRNPSALARRSIRCTLVLTGTEIHQLQGGAETIWDALHQPMDTAELVSRLGVRDGAADHAVQREVELAIDQLVDLAVLTAC